MANPHRGEARLALNGRHYTLKLTLGGLADLEDRLGAADLAALAARLGSGRLSSRDLVVLLQSGLHGGGHALTEAEIEAWPLEEGIEPILSAVVAMLERSFGPPSQPQQR